MSTSDPFTFRLTTSRADYDRGGRAGGGATHRTIVRATLTGGPDTPFGWQMETGDGRGPWTEITREAWEP